MNGPSVTQRLVPPYSKTSTNAMSFDCRGGGPLWSRRNLGWCRCLEGYGEDGDVVILAEALRCLCDEFGGFYGQGRCSIETEQFA